MRDQIPWPRHASSSPTGDARVLVDPFLKPNNPASPVTADELETRPTS